MCELFAMSAAVPTAIGFRLERLARRGGLEGPHRDGWGVAAYEGRDAYLLREPRAAAESEMVHFIEHHIPPTCQVISHIRYATQGDRALCNTQPFQRELGGRIHAFAHNGDLRGIGSHPDAHARRHAPVGTTDSEVAFCTLLERLHPLWERARGEPPPLAERWAAIACFAGELRAFGPANFLYADSDALFLHADRRTQDNGCIEPPGLHVLEQRCNEEAQGELPAAGIRIAEPCETTVLVASVPLTEGPWTPLARGQLAALVGGRLLRCAE
ncbi:MAG: class II glutamine amidotransferase [Thioalkalivibrio sp.]|nr:class II glutamine amidotransferase [Thioalkalivibrio sp.]